MGLPYNVECADTCSLLPRLGTIYSEYPGWASMHFIALGVGTISGGILGGHMVERHVSGFPCF